MEGLFALIVIGFIVFIAIILVIKSMRQICQPNEVLVFAGGTRVIKVVEDDEHEEREVGYRLVKGGAGIRKPMLEKVSRLDLTNMIIDVRVHNAYSGGGIPLIVEGVANVKIAGDEPFIHNAIERFLDKPRGEIERIARETLEGNLRGVLATLTPEKANEDKEAFAKTLLDEAIEDLNKLGIMLDTLLIQKISDEVQYLDSIGRKINAERQRDARIAEAKGQSEAAQVAADNEVQKGVAEFEKAKAVAKAEADRRIQDAKTRRTALVAEERAKIAAMVTGANAEVEVQKARIEQMRNKLQADIVVPADAERQRAVADAKGQASQAVEEGRALVEGLKSLTKAWKAAGGQAKQIFLLQKLEILLKTLASTIEDINIDQVTFIQSGDGSSAALQLTNFMKQLKGAAGVDLADLINAYVASREAPKGAMTPPPKPRPKG